MTRRSIIFRRRKLARMLSALLPLWPCSAAAELDKGHRILLERGLQIQGQAFYRPEDLGLGSYTFDDARYKEANFTAINWHWGPGNTSFAAANPTYPWGRWTNTTGEAELTPAEQPYKSQFVTFQYKDEQSLDNAGVRADFKSWFDAARPNFPDTILYTNQLAFNATDVNLATYMSESKPDMLCMDTYRWKVGNTEGTWHIFSDQQRYRIFALLGHDHTGAKPIPYGVITQAFHGENLWRDPSESELRVSSFGAWTMGYKFTSVFTYNYNTSSLFTPGYETNNPTPSYYQLKEINRQGKNLGPALVRLLSNNVSNGVNFIAGKRLDGNGNTVTNPNPISMPNWTVGINDPYLTGYDISNIGTKNNGLDGDVLLSWLKVLDETFDGAWADEKYFMVLNALTDPTGSAVDCRQQITLNFNFGASGINALLRLSRLTGAVETVPLTQISGSQYSLTFTLDGGTGDLFKFNDGAPFVGVQPIPTSMYWDNNPAGNNIGTGAGLGGSGTWDPGSNKWFNGSSNVPWGPGSDAVFWGTAGTVTLSAAQSASSVTFKTDGYVLTGSTLTTPSISVDSGVTATISSVVQGASLLKSGGGTLKLTGSNAYGAGTTVNAGVLQVSADANLGAVPGSLTTNITLDGGTLKWGAVFDISNTRGIMMGASGGTIDTQGFSNPSGYNATAGGFTGPGDLTKLGSGTFFAAAPSGGANTTWTGKLILKQGTWKIVASDGLPFNPPVAAGLQPAQVTLDGGTWQVGATISVSNARRGITVAAGGGTIDTQNFDLTWAGPLAGNVTTANLNKIGSGILRFTGVGAASTYSGNVNVNAGTLRLDAGISMGDLASVNLANVAGATLNVTGNETIGSLSGGGASGGNVTLGAFTLTTGGNNTFTTYAGVISGPGGITKAGSGTMTLTGANTYSGATTVSVGTLVLGQSLTSSSSLTIASGATAQLTQSGNKVLKTTSVSTAGTGRLDLKDNKLIVTVPDSIGSWNGSNYTGVTGMIKSGRGNGSWNGSGIVTSMSDATTMLTTLAIATAGDVSKTTFGGVSVISSDLLVMYTYNGDADLTGDIDGDDYFRIDAGYSAHTSGYTNGDFDYSGLIDADDYWLIDRNYSRQGAAFSAGPTTGVAAVPEPVGMVFVGAVLAAFRRRQRRR